MLDKLSVGGGRRGCGVCPSEVCHEGDVNVKVGGSLCVNAAAPAQLDSRYHEMARHVHQEIDCASYYSPLINGARSLLPSLNCFPSLLTPAESRLVDNAPYRDS